MKAIRTGELRALLESDQPVEILDIRPRRQFQDAHIEGSHSLPSAEVSAASVLLSRQLLSTEPLYLVSQGGAMAQLSAFELERQGLDNLIAVAGGMHAWQHDGFPSLRATAMTIGDDDKI
jgi:rhodanese-related sulfurtransferase